MDWPSPASGPSLEFLKDDHGDFQEDMLREENVRGYQGKSSVNDGIAGTLRNPDSAEFWVLNNGITILADELTPAGMSTLNIKDPQIVNGLQTSRNDV